MLPRKIVEIGVNYVHKKNYKTSLSRSLSRAPLEHHFRWVLYDSSCVRNKIKKAVKEAVAARKCFPAKVKLKPDYAIYV